MPPPKERKQRNAFLDAIKDDPESDAPRLIFADWLDDHGEPERAKFIRIECRAEGLDSDDAERIGLASAALTLWREHRADWLGPLEPMVSKWGREMSRGLLSLNVNEEQLASVPADAITVEAFRWVDALDLHGRPEEGLSRIPANEIVRLNLFRRPSDDHWNQPTEPPTDFGRFTRLRSLCLRLLPSLEWAESLQRLPRLSELDVVLWSGMPDWFEPFLHASAFDRIRHLRLDEADNSGPSTRYAVIRSLINRPKPTRITTLSLSLTGGPPTEIVPLLVGSEAFPELTTLALNGNWTVDLLRALKKTTPRVPLRKFTIGELTDAGLRELIKSPLLSGLERLTVRGGIRKGATPLQASSAIDHRSISALAESASVSGLRVLNLTGAQMGPEGAKAIGRSRNLANLKQFSNSSSFFTHAPSPGQMAEGATDLLTSPHLQGLTRLSLPSQAIPPDSIEAMVASKGFPALESLNLSFNPIGDRGAKALARWPGLKNLSGLCVLKTELTDNGAIALAESPYLSTNTWLVVGMNPLKERGQEALRQRLGDHAIFEPESGI